MLQVVNLSIGFDKPLIEDINIVVNKPMLIQVMGPNGAGKTTFLKTLAGLLKPIKGSVYINGVDVTGDAEKAGRFVTLSPQMVLFKQSEVFPISVWEFVEFGAELCHKKKGVVVSKDELRNIVKSALSSVGIGGELWGKSLWKLSGGQRQRVFIARAIACDMPIVLLDEPLSSIDPEGRVEIANVIGSLSKTKIVFATCHDPEMLLKYTSFVMLLGKGKYVMEKPENVLRGDVLRKFYGDAVIEFVDHIHVCDYHI